MIKKPLYKIKIDEDDEFTGVDFISLVDDPAIEINFITLSKENQIKFSFNKDKKLLIGPILIPDKPINRYDEKRGEYDVVFEKETIEKISKKFNKNNLNKNINFQHSSDSIVKAYLTENWIIEDKQYDKSTLYNFDLPIGTWFGTVYIEDDKFWNDVVKKGEVKGFSIELVSFLEQSKYAILQNDNVMSSNVAGYRYNTNNGTLVITFNNGSEYEYFAVDFQEYEDIVLGDAVCVTEGSNDFGSWFVGKTPSVGAAVHKYLVKTKKRFRQLMSKIYPHDFNYTDDILNEISIIDLSIRNEHYNDIFINEMYLSLDYDNKFVLLFSKDNTIIINK
jgi:hypothetical protein